MIIDFGDVQLDIGMRVKSLHRYSIRWHIGAPIETTEIDGAQAIKGHSSHNPNPGRPDILMDLMSDKQVPLSVQWTDEHGNVVATPAGATAAYTVDDATIIALVDNGDGTATAAATGTVGTANVTGTFHADGAAFTGVLQINVVAGLAERVNIVAGEPVEITPDAKV